MIPIRDEISSRRFPLITILIILINVVVYLYQFSLGHAEQAFILKYAVVAKSLITMQPVHSVAAIWPPLTLITSQFIHGGFFHLAGNMLFLWVFGDNIESGLGYIRFPIFYLACGVISGIIQVLSYPNSEIPLIGASGAIAGIMGAYFITYPRARVYTLIFIWIVRLPAVIFLGVWFIYQLALGVPTYGSDEPGIAYFAHIGGFVSGMVLYKVWKKYD